MAKSIKSAEKELKELLAQEAELDKKEIEQMILLEQAVTDNLWEYFKEFKWQTRTLEMLRKKLIVIVPAPNKIGKTELVGAVTTSWCSGYEAWNEVEQTHPDAVKVGKKYYRSSSLGIAPPVKIRITGEDWRHHLGQTVVPALMKYIPADQLKRPPKKNSEGVEWFFEFKNGSTIELLTHDQKTKLYESWHGHGWIPDEPPPKDKYSAMARGLYGNRGKIFIPTTPLKEAWMLDDLILTNRTDVGIIDNLTCLDNEIFYKNDYDILFSMGLSEEQIKEVFNLILYVDDKGIKAEKYIIENTPVEEQEKILDLYFLKFAKDTPLDEKPSRFFGTFKKLIGLVIKGFKNQYTPDGHIIKAFEVPTKWPVVPMIDFHLNKPHALSFWTIEPTGRKYCIDEVWEHLKNSEIADVIIRKMKKHSWNIEDAFIDPLAKGDTAYIRNREGEDIEDAFTTISEALEEHGIELHAASKDKVSGITNIREWLEGVNGLPICYFFDTLQSAQGGYGIIYEIQRLVYDDKNDDKPAKVDDHFIENFYRFTLAGIEYVDPKQSLLHVPPTPPGKDEWMGK